MSEPLTVTDTTFQTDVLASALPVLVDFWATWCGPCKRIEATVQQVADEYQDTLRVVRLNVDENTATAMRFGVMGLPTLLLFDGSEPAGERLVGEVTYEQIVGYLQEASIGRQNND
jgi:thioredoxin 1